MNRLHLLASSPQQTILPDVSVSTSEVFPGIVTPSAEIFFQTAGWFHPVTYFVGRNGSGKSRTAKIVAQRVQGRLLSTDRLAGLTLYDNYGWTSVPASKGYRGIPLGDGERNQARTFSQQSGSGIDEMYALKEQPEVWLRVAAFLRSALGRVIELREDSGFLDPYIRIGGLEYSLLRDEGHGLREIVILLTAIYREDWKLLVVDEPELHLHPSMVRLWLGELDQVCRTSQRRAIIVTHEPSIIRPLKSEDLGAVWHFAPGRASTRFSEHVPAGEDKRVTSSLQTNPQLVSQLVFSPRPVLVEGIHDVAALTVALARTQPSEVAAQTDLIECGGSGGVALWFEISQGAGLDVRAVADLDACLAPEVQRVMDKFPDVVRRYRDELSAEPATTKAVMGPLLEAMRKAGVDSNPKSRANWIANDLPPETGWASRIRKILEIWKDAGLWLHHQGTLEDVLNMTNKASVNTARIEAAKIGEIDFVAGWCAYSLDPLGDVEILLCAAVERIAHSIMEALRVNPEILFTAPVGGSALSDARLVSVTPVSAGIHRIEVLRPNSFAGRWLEFSRETPSSQLILNYP